METSGCAQSSYEEIQMTKKAHTRTSAVSEIMILESGKKIGTVQSSCLVSLVTRSVK